MTTFKTTVLIELKLNSTAYYLDIIIFLTYTNK